MNSKSKTIQQHILIALFFTVFLLISCKKETTNLGVDNPEMEVVTLNAIISYNGAVNVYKDTSISIFGNDISIFLAHYPNYKSVNIYCYDQLNFQKEFNFRINNNYISVLPTFDEGERVDNFRSAWLDRYDYENYGGYIYSYSDYNLPSATKGINGLGDKFIAIRLNTSGSSYKYGWIKLNLSTDANTLIIKEAALAKVADKTIAIGAK